MTLIQKTLLASALLASFAAPSFAQMQGQVTGNCATRFAMADVNGDGSLGNGEGDSFYERKWGTDTRRPDSVPIISRQEFLKDCRKGTY